MWRAQMNVNNLEFERQSRFKAALTEIWPDSVSVGPPGTDRWSCWVILGVRGSYSDASVRLTMLAWVERSVHQQHALKSSIHSLHTNCFCLKTWLEWVLVCNWDTANENIINPVWCSSLSPRAKRSWSQSEIKGAKYGCKMKNCSSCTE